MTNASLNKTNEIKYTDGDHETMNIYKLRNNLDEIPEADEMEQATFRDKTNSNAHNKFIKDYKSLMKEESVFKNKSSQKVNSSTKNISANRDLAPINHRSARNAESPSKRIQIGKKMLSSQNEAKKYENGRLIDPEDRKVNERVPKSVKNIFGWR